ncbi:MAG: MFS transporter [Bacteroidales bacterium]|nr:MFS transporter [Bacteroidales bacterium]
MFKRILSFYKTSQPSAVKVPAEKVDGYYKKLRIQAFVAGTLGYSLYYVCRTSLNVMKQPIIDSGFLNATQLGLIGACLYWAYAAGKFVNGFLADHSNIKKFMATGLIVSAVANFIMGILGMSSGAAGIASSVMFVAFAVIWAINGWSQSMGAAPAIISLSRWFPLRIRGTFYGFFSASHNFGEGLSFIFVSLLVSAAGWQWGFFGAAIAGVVGVVLITLWLHDTPESKGLPSIEVLADEKTDDGMAEEEVSKADASRIQRAVLRNPGVWILALSSAFMYMSRYAINEWGMFFLQKVKGFGLEEAAMIIAVNTIAGIAGTVCAGWISDTVFKGDRKWPALVAGILEATALVLFLYGGDGWFINVLAMALFGIAIGVLICFVGGLMAVDLVPRKATGAALGIVGLASYIAAGLMNIISGWLIDGNAVIDSVTGEKVYDFTYVSVFWIGAAVVAFLLPILNWRRKKMVI